MIAALQKGQWKPEYLLFTVWAEPPKPEEVKIVSGRSVVEMSASYRQKTAAWTSKGAVYSTCMLYGSQKDKTKQRKSFVEKIREKKKEKSPE